MINVEVHDFLLRLVGKRATADHFIQAATKGFDKQIARLDRGSAMLANEHGRLVERQAYVLQAKRRSDHFLGKLREMTTPPQDEIEAVA